MWEGERCMQTVSTRSPTCAPALYPPLARPRCPDPHINKQRSLLHPEPHHAFPSRCCLVGCSVCTGPAWCAPDLR